MPQVADVELHLVARDAVGIAPDELEQLVAREHLVRVLHERGEQLELERRQLHVAALHAHAAAARSRSARSCRRTPRSPRPCRRSGGGAPARARAAPAGRTASRRSRPRPPKAPHLLELLRAGGQHDHRHVREVADPLERLVAVEVGHRHVEDHERGGRSEQVAERRAPVAAPRPLCSRRARAARGAASDVLVVVDDQDPWRVRSYRLHTIPIAQSLRPCDDSAAVARVLDLRAARRHRRTARARRAPARARAGRVRRAARPTSSAFDAAVVEPGDSRRARGSRAPCARRTCPVLFTSIYPAETRCSRSSRPRTREAVPALRARARARRRRCSSSPAGGRAIRRRPLSRRLTSHGPCGRPVLLLLVADACRLRQRRAGSRPLRRGRASRARRAAHDRRRRSRRSLQVTHPAQAASRPAMSSSAEGRQGGRAAAP